MAIYSNLRNTAERQQSILLLHTRMNIGSLFRSVFHTQLSIGNPFHFSTHSWALAIRSTLRHTAEQWQYIPLSETLLSSGGNVFRSSTYRWACIDNKFYSVPGWAMVIIFSSSRHNYRWTLPIQLKRRAAPQACMMWMHPSYFTRVLWAAYRGLNFVNTYYA